MSVRRVRYGMWLRQQRKRAGLTQLALGAAVDVDRTYIARIESGDIRLPGADVRERFHKYFKTTDSDLVAAGVAISAEDFAFDPSEIDLNDPLARTLFVDSKKLTEKGKAMLADYLATLRKYESLPDDEEAAE